MLKTCSVDLAEGREPVRRRRAECRHAKYTFDWGNNFPKFRIDGNEFVLGDVDSVTRHELIVRARFTSLSYSQPVDRQDLVSAAIISAGSRDPHPRRLI